MKKSELKRFAPDSADYVVAHALLSEKKGRGPSVAYCGVLNPKKALFYALLSKKFETEVQDKNDLLASLKTDKFAGKHVAMLSKLNSLVVASGDDQNEVLKKAQKKGVQSPFVVFLPQTEDGDEN